MDKSELIAAATQEIVHPILAVVAQFLGIHEIAFKDDKPEVAGIEINASENEAIIYFTVKGEAFHFAIYFDIEPEVQVRWADTEDFSHVYFIAVSDTLRLNQLLGLTSLRPTDRCDIGDKTGFRNDIANVSSIEFKPNPEPGATERKLKKLLTFLEQDVAGVRRLVEEADGAIQVHTVFHNGNTMLGGIHLDKDDIKRLAALNLAIDFDIYAKGNFFKD